MALMLLLVCNVAHAQTITATGRVVDANQDPLIGATIKVVGGSGGTITDFEGKFSLPCKQGATLDVSYVGYVSQHVKAGTGLRITLNEDAKTLDETVVVGVGYGTMRKSDLTGSIATVNAKDLRKGVITSTEQMLQGKVAGLSVVQSSGAVESGSSL